eukprot:GILJ01002497.1.p1 GENE.GILJ01002497.1~~GILJ01002497.1.p1  ORF type:complete len:399 (+),score=57.00 GILJ01002497.1:48-1244(+)
MALASRLVKCSATKSNSAVFGNAARQAGMATFAGSKLTIEKTKNPKPKPASKSLLFGRNFTDHMFEVDWSKSEGWTSPRITPYHKLEIDPAASCLHYALECFEGMKAYKDDNNQIRMFRPMKNMDRLHKSCLRICLPDFDKNDFMECIKELVKVDHDWIPQDRGYSLYLRPTAISTTPFLGVQPPSEAKLFCILSPVGPYYPEGFKPIKLYADNKNVRAWPGGTGDSKLGANYAGTILPAVEAAKKGYSQVMWLFGEQNWVTEVGTMNQFFFWKRPDGKKELITAPLTDGTILHGVTRDSVLDLCRGWGEFEVTERPYTMHEVTAAIKENRLLEAFGAGTAAIVAPVEGIHFQGQDYKIPLDPENPSAGAGKLAQRLAQTIMDIQYGKQEHPWSVLVQ